MGPPAAQLEGPDLSWYRDHQPGCRRRGRCDEGQGRLGRPADSDAEPPVRRAVRLRPARGPRVVADRGRGDRAGRIGVAEWRDTTALPRLCRDTLEKASGITVPSSQFVLKVIMAYILALVPLNWLVCRLLLNRREWAWIVVPLLALGFAVGVERVAAYDMGYDSACDEIDLLEVQGAYPRAHLSRFAALYTTGRAKYAIAYPNEPTAVALPFNNERAIGGEDVTTAVWQSYPVPALQNFSVQPRSLADVSRRADAGALRFDRPRGQPGSTDDRQP